FPYTTLFRSRAVAQRAPRVAVAGLGDAPLAAPRPRRVLRGRQAEVTHELARGVEPHEIAELGHQDNGAGELHAAQRLDRLDDRVQSPALHRVVQLALQALQSLLLLADGAHVLLEDNLLGRGRAHHLG